MSLRKLLQTIVHVSLLNVTRVLLNNIKNNVQRCECKQQNVKLKNDPNVHRIAIVL